MSISGFDLERAAREIKQGLESIGEGLKAIAKAIEQKQ